MAPTSDTGAGEPGCDRDGCGALLVRMYRERGIDANASTVPPLVDSGYEQLNVRCPHGVLWFVEPTSEQRAAWARERTP